MENIWKSKIYVVLGVLY